MTRKMTTPFVKFAAMKIIAVALLALTGCSGQNLSATLSQVNVQREPSQVAGTPADVYGLIASGAMSCWFAPTGQLKKTHVFHADAEPPTKGGAAEIAVHERDLANGQTWGSRVFKIALKPSGEQTELAVENLKLPKAVADAMRDDVFDWAQGGKGCKLKPAEVVIPQPTLTKAKKPVRSSVTKP